MNYISLAEIYEKLESTSKRLEKTFFVSKLLQEAKNEDLREIIFLLQGRLFPEWDERKIGVAERLVIKAIQTASGISSKEIEEEWKKTGDLGLVAQNLIGKKKQVTLFSEDLTVHKVFSNLQKLATLEGAGSVDRKIKLIAELLSSAKPLEAKFVVRTSLEDLRVGIGSGSIRDAICWAYFPDIRVNYDEKAKSITPDNREEYNEYIASIEAAYNKTNDFALVAEKAQKGIEVLKKVDVVPGVPLKVMLAQKVADVKEGFDKVGVPAELEYKYDGFRMNIHKSGSEITIFTRRLENVTNQFPEVVDAVKKNVDAESFILDGEAVGFDPKTGNYMPFQMVSQRIRRKYNIHEMATKFPVELNLFDVLYYNKKNLLHEPFEKRRELLEKIIKEKKNLLVLAKKLITEDEKEAEAFYKEALSKGNEGVMLKNLKGIYKPGSRVGYMVKLKPTMDTLDLVIVGAEWGEGKRSGWLTSFTVACKNGDEFVEIGKVGTGIKELEGEGVTFQQLTDVIKPHIKSEKGREVIIKPSIVIEVKFEEIQRSPTYSSGYAMRFPRLVNLRDDRRAEEISEVSEVKKAFEKQRHRGNVH